MWKTLAFIPIILIITVLIKWQADSKDYGETLIYSKDKKPVVQKETDELFGVETEKTVWKDGFWLGLLPGDDSVSLKLFLGVVPLSCVCLLLSGVGFFFGYKRKTKKKLV